MCRKVDLVTTDGFLYPNAVLDREGLMEKKGFPDSYDLRRCDFLRISKPAGVRRGRWSIRIDYDVILNEWVEI